MPTLLPIIAYTVSISMFVDRTSPILTVYIISVTFLLNSDLLSEIFHILFIILDNAPKTALPVQSKPITARAPTNPLLKSIVCKLSYIIGLSAIPGKCLSSTSLTNSTALS